MMTLKRACFARLARYRVMSSGLDFIVFLNLVLLCFNLLCSLYLCVVLPLDVGLIKNDNYRKRILCVIMS